MYVCMSPHYPPPPPPHPSSGIVNVGFNLMVAASIDHHYLLTSRRRESLFYSGLTLPTTIESSIVGGRS